jgi:predicted secreted hydrolase
MRPRVLWLLLTCGLLAAGLAAGLVAVSGEKGTEPRATLSLVETLGGGDTTGYRRALEPRAFVFPDDHGPHEDFRTEWWYVTANLESADGDRYGVQFTLFRSALAPDPPATSQGWATNQVYMAHLALTDVRAARFRAFERFARGAVGLAGARVRPFRAWLEDWSLEGADDASPDAEDPIWPLTLRAAEGAGTAAESGVRLRLTPLKPLVLQGEGGLSRKGPEPGNASYYYSFTRLAAEGDVVVDGRTVPVTGTAWLDREWSTSVLSEGQVGWDWFALQLDDGRDLMVYHLRRADGSPDAMSEGVLVDAAGTATRLAQPDFGLEPVGRWVSPLDGTVYPSGWRVRVPDHALDLEVTPVLPDQELDLTFRYWEGAVDVVGRAGGAPVSGRGYVELTGYAGGGPPSKRMRTR